MGKPRQTQVSGNARKAALNAVESRPEKKQKLKNTDRKNRNTDEASTNPQTCCSNCQTVFEVSLELLSTSDNRVRCGECLSVFDALANLRDSRQNGDSTLPQARNEGILSEGVVNDTASLDLTYSDFDLFSSDAGLPDIQFFDSTRDVRDFHFDDIADETFSDTLFAQDATVDAQSTLHNQGVSQDSSSIALGGDVGFISDESHCEPLIFNYRDAESQAETPDSLQTPETAHLNEIFEDELLFDEPVDATTRGSAKDSLYVLEPVSSPWLLRGGLFAIVLIIAGSLYGYRERDALLNNGFLRPLLSTACDLLSCQLPGQIDLDGLRAVDRSVVTHPTVANALIIKFGIVNQASFSQPYPVLEIRLTDRAGRLVVRNRFLPSEYLRGWQQFDVLDMGKRLDIGLVVEDPGNTAMSFELDFYEVK